MIKQNVAYISFLLLFSSLAQSAKPGDNVPECSARYIDSNETINISDQHDKVIYVDFWASWCPPCKRSFPSLNHLHKELKEQGFEVVAINLDENKNDALVFLQNNPVDFSVVYDGEGKCPNAFEVMAMPSSFIIDKKGIVREVHLGFNDDSLNKIRATILSLLSEK